MHMGGVDFLIERIREFISNEESGAKGKIVHFLPAVFISFRSQLLLLLISVAILRR